jgi:predicted phage-related endonuclease
MRILQGGGRHGLLRPQVGVRLVRAPILPQVDGPGMGGREAMINPEVRKQGIGCSEIAAALGMSAWTTRWALAAMKRGLLVSPEPTDRQIWGHMREPANLLWYARQRNVKLALDHPTRKHPDYPLVYTYDATVEGERRVVDSKVVGFDQADKWRDGPPDDALLQCVGYMACGGFAAADLVVSVGGDVPRIVTVERDERLERSVLRQVTAFWDRHIAGNEEIPIDGSDAAARWLQQMYPRHKRPDLRGATPEEIELLAEYEAVRIVEDDACERRCELENRLKAAIQDREGLCWPGGKFTWRKTRDRKIVDWQSMAIGLRNEYVADPAKRKEIEEFYTRTKEGSRRIYFKSAGYSEARETEDAA